MVHDAATGRHARRGDDDRRLAKLGHPLRSGRIRYLDQTFRPERYAPAQLRSDIRGSGGERVAIHAKRRERHRAVDVHRHVGQVPCLLEVVEVVEQDLGAIDGERRDDH